MDELSDLLEIAALQRLKAAYFRFYDTQDWPSWLALFCDDAVLRADHEVIWSAEPAAPPLELAGKEALRDYVTTRGPSRRTVHHGHTPEIDLLSADRATGIWAMEDIVEYADHSLHGHGHYHETYTKVDGLWHFQTIHLKRLRLVITERSSIGEGPG